MSASFFFAPDPPRCDLPSAPVGVVGSQGRLAPLYNDACYWLSNLGICKGPQALCVLFKCRGPLGFTPASPLWEVEDGESQSRCCVRSQWKGFLSSLQDDPLRLPLHRRQDRADRSHHALGHHCQHPAEQEQHGSHRSLQQGCTAELAKIQEPGVGGTVLSCSFMLPSNWRLLLLLCLIAPSPLRFPAHCCCASDFQAIQEQSGGACCVPGLELHPCAIPQQASHMSTWVLEMFQGRTKFTTPWDARGCFQVHPQTAGLRGAESWMLIPNWAQALDTLRDKSCIFLFCRALIFLRQYKYKAIN